MEALIQYWPIIITALGTIVWLVRLEGKHVFLERMVDMQAEEIDKLSDLRDLVTSIKNDIEWLKKTIEKTYNINE